MPPSATLCSHNIVDPPSREELGDSSDERLVPTKYAGRSRTLRKPSELKQRESDIERETLDRTAPGQHHRSGTARLISDRRVADDFDVCMRANDAVPGGMSL